MWSLGTLAKWQLCLPYAILVQLVRASPSPQRCYTRRFLGRQFSNYRVNSGTLRRHYGGNLDVQGASRLRQLLDLSGLLHPRTEPAGGVPKSAEMLPLEHGPHLRTERRKLSAVEEGCILRKSDPCRDRSWASYCYGGQGAHKA